MPTAAPIVIDPNDRFLGGDVTGEVDVGSRRRRSIYLRGFPRQPGLQATAEKLA
jgi:hypothetical protein